MDKMITEINDSLNKIIDNLASEKETSTEALAIVDQRINEKIEEAKQYKTEVEDTKEKIKTLENEIATLETDLHDLNERFGKKDFNAILEAGNKEINTKIVERQNQIGKLRKKINELTDKAKNIKDLLLNLRKDKDTKELKLDTFTKAYNYYNNSLSKIIEFAAENPNSLDTYVTQTFNYENIEEVKVEETGIFEEIESMNKDDDAYKVYKNNIFDEEEVLEDTYTKLKNESDALEESHIDKEYTNVFGDDSVENPSVIEEMNISQESPIKENATSIIGITEEELNKDDAVSETINISEEELNKDDAVSETINISEEELNKDDAVSETTNISEEELNIQTNGVLDKEEKKVGKTPDPEKIIETNETESSTTNLKTPVVEAPTLPGDITSFLKENHLDYEKFNSNDQEYLTNNFNASSFKAIIDVLTKHHIDLKYLYDAPRILNMKNPEELTNIISKLLMISQTTDNIGYILNQLLNITSVNLNEVVKSFGSEIKEANITDIIIKARNLNKRKQGLKPNLNYLKTIGFTEEEVSNMLSKMPASGLENLTNFNKIITQNYNTLNAYGISNIKTVFAKHTHMFLMNPDRFKAIFDKYDDADLVRCIEKNAAVIEKL